MPLKLNYFKKNKYNKFSQLLSIKVIFPNDITNITVKTHALINVLAIVKFSTIKYKQVLLTNKKKTRELL